jgi:peptidoglycan hydrolase FlgJ
MDILPATIAATSSDDMVLKRQNSRLAGAAHEFEASMMMELLKPLQQSSAIDDKDSEQGSEGALISYSTQALGKGLSEHGGIGIARKVLAQLGGEKAR